MTLEVVFARRALSSLRRIDDYLRERSPTGARNVRQEIDRTLDLLADHPGIGVRLRPGGLRSHTTRRYRYRIIYRATDRALEVLDILHSRRRGPSRE
jgi:plasmid stabilization system protein ParE